MFSRETNTCGNGRLGESELLLKDEGGTVSRYPVSQTVRRDPLLVGSAETER